MKNRFSSSIFFIVAILLSITKHSVSLPQNELYPNLYRLELIREWISLKPDKVKTNDCLRDNIPDRWSIQAWGGATAIFGLDENNPFNGKASAFIHRTNAQGGTAFTQDIWIPKTSQIYISAYAKGTKGAIQIWLGNRETGEWTKDAGWLNIPSTETWQFFTMRLKIPNNVNLVRLWLRATGDGTIRFDEIYIGTEASPDQEANLIENPGFEIDGVVFDPTWWWQTHVHPSAEKEALHNILSENLSYLNMYDMLKGNFALIQERAKGLGDHCALTPEMTSWLLSKADAFEKAAGATAREMIYRLTIQLAPNCPQPYAALAQLFEQYHSYWMAAELYQKAANLAGNTSTSGRYSFEEGILRLRYTGELDLAAIAFRKAVEHSGWEASSWHRGAALFYLGQALESLGNLEESVMTYQRVLDCRDCIYYHEYAHRKITSLISSHP